jgi:hypothetical protein
MLDTYTAPAQAQSVSVLFWCQYSLWNCLLELLELQMHLKMTKEQGFPVCAVANSLIPQRQMVLSHWRLTRVGTQFSDPAKLRMEFTCRERIKHHAHAWNPSHSRDRDQEDQGSKPALTISS